MNYKAKLEAADWAVAWDALSLWPPHRINLCCYHVTIKYTVGTTHGPRKRNSSTGVLQAGLMKLRIGLSCTLIVKSSGPCYQNNADLGKKQIGGSSVRSMHPFGALATLVGRLSAIHPLDKGNSEIQSGVCDES